ncbi:thioredoxin domain-containing protein [Bacteroidota bacterium]
MSNQENDHTYTNKLIHESSPYLLQHAHNPVNWYPWGEEALSKAKQENKMLIISIGYAACHWCHVMEHESFEDTAVARIMNENFIAIKVDREERPDVDQVYMNAVNLISGRGGWPLNAFALPDGKPFYAGTYYTKDDWVKVLNYFTGMYKDQPESLSEQAEKVSEGIRSLEYIPMNEDVPAFTMDQAGNTVRGLISGMDLRKGGINRAPKFPMPGVWEYLLHYNYLSREEKALESAKITLDNMAWGGIYDHVGGGFARYSTDANWHVPHFEKMLYDNGQLVSLYSHAWQITGNPLYKDVVYETLEFIRREMTSGQGGFYSSLDADSEGEEGKFYVWTQEEIEKVLGKDAELFIEYFNITPEGNWEDGKNIPFRDGSDDKLAEKLGLSPPQIQKKIFVQKSQLLKAREKRVRPGLDDKILSSWNALMLRGYVDAYTAFNDQKFLDAAVRNAEFLLQNAISESGEMTRNHKEGKSTIHGFLDDYAFTISAFIGLYQATFDERWLSTANKLTAYSMEHFHDQNSGMFFYTHKEHSKLIARNMEISDNVIPGSNSEMAKNLFILGHYYYNEDYLRISEQMLANVQEDMQKNVFYFSNWAILELNFINKPYEVVILGDEYGSFQKELNNKYMPDAILSGGKQEGDLALHKNKLQEKQTTIYVCRGKMCKLPVITVSQALEQIMQ